LSDKVESEPPSLLELLASIAAPTAKVTAAIVPYGINAGLFSPIQTIFNAQYLQQLPS
jgi:hypothetical protein